MNTVPRIVSALRRVFIHTALLAGIAFAGTAGLHAQTTVTSNKTGTHNGYYYTYWKDGGTATMTASGGVLVDFLPVEEMLNLAEAVIRVFHERGDYAHKQRNRMKFLIKAMGWEAWKAAFDEALSDVGARGGHPLPFDIEPPAAELPPDGPRPAPSSIQAISTEIHAARVSGPGIVPEPRVLAGADPRAYSRWHATNVRLQKQPGFAVATVTVPLGDVTGAHFRVLARLAEAHPAP